MVEFPNPGERGKHLLPVLVDPEENRKKQYHAAAEVENDEGEKKAFWMPVRIVFENCFRFLYLSNVVLLFLQDKLCKACYCCEEAFTMYRRRHHCRMCGQVFCNTCSSFWIDGAFLNVQGPARCCQLCCSQMNERNEREMMKGRTMALEDRQSVIMANIASSVAPTVSPTSVYVTEMLNAVTADIVASELRSSLATVGDSKGTHYPQRKSLLLHHVYTSLKYHRQTFTSADNLNYMFVVFVDSLSSAPTPVPNAADKNNKEAIHELASAKVQHMTHLQGRYAYVVCLLPDEECSCASFK